MAIALSPPLVDAAVASVLATDQGVQVARRRDGETAEGLVRRTRPDVVLVGGAPGRADATRERLDEVGRLTRGRRPPRVGVVALRPSREEAVRLFRAGARGYISGESGIQELGDAVATLLGGAIHVSPDIQRGLAEEALLGGPPAGDGPAAPLSDREYQVMRLLAEGLGCPEIARVLSISVKTANTHRGAVLHKLGLRNTVELARFAIREGLVAA